uniref:Atg5 n=1 Tax=Arundo donax TaxID=35708 RepID=A0A0A9DHV2_ARUDO
MVFLALHIEGQKELQLVHTILMAALYIQTKQCQHLVADRC